jgi:carboxymethylenebutenolidase
MSERTVDLSTPDGTMNAYEATPEGDAQGAVIVVVEGFGVNAHIKDVTRRFATAGYHAVAPHFFHRSGQDPLEDYSVGFDTIKLQFQGLSDETLLTDTDAALEHLRAAGFDDSRIGIVGFCFGGRVSFLAALNRALGAAVGFYGGGITRPSLIGQPALIGEAAALRTPWLGFFGDADQQTPVEEVEQLRAALGAAPVATEIVLYPGAAHGFHNDVREAYHEASAKDAWARTLAWLDAHLS